MDGIIDGLQQQIVFRLDELRSIQMEYLTVTLIETVKCNMYEGII